MSRTCNKCGHAFRDPSTLKRHLEKKKPCDPIVEPLSRKGNVCKYCGRGFASATSMHRHVRQSCKIANSEEGMDKLLEHTLQRQNRELRQEVAEVKAQMAELSSLMKVQLALVPAPVAREAAPSPPRADAHVQVQQAHQVNTGTVTNVQNIIQINPWDGERRIEIGVGQIAAAFMENARLKEYASMGDHDLVDPEIAPPYVTELLMDLVKRGHADPSARNVYLNPRRSDQVLVHKKSGQWEVLPLAEATRLLLDGIAQGIHQVVRTYAELKQLPMEAQNAMSMAGMMYKEEPEEYVKRAKTPMSAHLTNTAPEGAPPGTKTPA